MSAYKAVLFDLDGTLLDTIEDLAEAMNQALTACRLPARTAAECKHFVGDGVRNFAMRAMPPDRCNDKAAVARVTELYHQAYSKNWDHRTRPYEGISELLDALTARGLAMVVYSNKPDDFTNLTVSKLLPRWQFAAVIGHREGFNHKPDPAAALQIAARLGVQPSEMLYVGDTGTDMKTAVAAGMFPVGALWGFRDAAELTANGAKALIARPLELLELLK
jgi:phosphoglycolate phosphatase